MSSEIKIGDTVDVTLTGAKVLDAGRDAIRISSEHSGTFWVDAQAPGVTVTVIEPEPKRGEVWKDRFGGLWIMRDTGSLICNKSGYGLRSPTLFREEFGPISRLYPPPDQP